MRTSHSSVTRSTWSYGLLGFSALVVIACGGVAADEPAGAVVSTDAALCQGFDSYTAAIAERTIECRGTIGPQSFRIDAAGDLARAFDQCESGDRDVLRDIDELLSVQHRELLNAQRCIAGRYREWSKDFSRLGIASCPNWEKLETYGAPTHERLAAHVAALGSDPDAPRLAVLDQHENYRYRVTPAANAEPSGIDTAETAAACAGGFPGFVLSAKGEQVIGDPAFWLSGYVFPAGANPFLETPGYCHLMSHFGPLPGNIFAHRNRVGECCTRYVGGVHVMMRLELDCLDTEGIDCVATCI